MRYHIMMPGDTREDALLDSNLLGEDTGFGVFWPGSGLKALMTIADKRPNMLRYITILNEKSQEFTVEEFLKQIKNLRIKRQKNILIYMASQSKEQTLGKYVKKVGFFDIRQKPPTRHGKIVEGQTWEVFLYHGKKKVGGPFKSHDAAIICAEELMSQGYTTKKSTKRT